MPKITVTISTQISNRLITIQTTYQKKTHCNVTYDDIVNCILGNAVYYVDDEEVINDISLVEYKPEK